MSDMTGVDLVSLDYQSRLETLQSSGIALWDVIAEAERPGSLDQKITNARANDLKELLTSLPRLRAIAFNGKKAASLGATALYGIDIEFFALPSSSPAYTLGLEAKRRDWAVLAQYRRPLELRFSNTI